MIRPVKSERVATVTPLPITTTTTTGTCSISTDVIDEPGTVELNGYATIVSRYKAVNTMIVDEEEIGRADPDRFNSIINQVDRLHRLVQRPRDQLVDAEVLLGVTNSLVSCVKAQGHDGLTACDFVNCLLRDFGNQARPGNGAQGVKNSMDWKNIGVAVSDIFRSCTGCHTMIGPMGTELKKRKAVVRKRVKPTESSQPEEVHGLEEKRVDTDKNMATMFNILRTNRSVKLANLVLDRKSFARTVENLFTLSFLVKDGRAEIKVNENGSYLVSPRNAASAAAVALGEVAYRHFVFRFDFKDWKLMASVVGVGEELMPNRDQTNLSCDERQNPSSKESQEAGPNTLIRKLSRNRGLILQEEEIVESSSHTREGPAVTQWKRKQ